MYRIQSPASFTSAPWKNGGGITHEIARKEENGALIWRLSIAEVTSDGPFSRFEGLSRILTVIDGNGIDLHTPDRTLHARLGRPVRFSGDLSVESRMCDGPIRDLNVIYDASRIRADVTLRAGPDRITTGPYVSGFLALNGAISVDGDTIPVGSFALGTGGTFELAAGASGLLVTLAAL